MLQRHMRIGYSRAARIVDAMEEAGVIGPARDRSQVREVLDYGQAAPPPEE
jgi:S-DNA-T family DNA segregation ATPase FtsK/SpoIIIE